MQQGSKVELRFQVNQLEARVSALEYENKYLTQCVENQKGSIQYMADKRKPLLEVIGTLSDLLLEK